MDREYFRQRIANLKWYPVANEKVNGTYLGEYIDSARLNLEDDTEKAEFIYALAEVFASNGFTDENFNTDQRKRFVKWVDKIDTPYAAVCLYSFYQFEIDCENAIISKEVCIENLNELSQEISKITDIDVIIYSVKIIPSFWLHFEHQIETFLKGVDPFENVKEILELAESACRYTGRFSSKLVRAIRHLPESVIKDQESKPSILTIVYGKRGMRYLNVESALILGKMSERRQDKAILYFSLGLLEGNINTKEKELFQKLYGWEFSQRIEMSESIRDYIYFKEIGIDCNELSFSDWEIFYDLEKEQDDDVNRISLKPLRFDPLNNPNKWNSLANPEKAKLLKNLFNETLNNHSLQADDVKKYDDFCQVNDRKSLLEIFAEYFEKQNGVNIIGKLIDQEIWAPPKVEDIHNMEDTMIPAWIKDYTKNPNSVISGRWIMDYFETYKKSPDWLQCNNIEILKHQWIMEAEISFSEQYFFMVLESLLANNPNEFTQFLNKIIFGDYWRREGLDLRRFLSPDSLHAFTKFLASILKDKDDVLLKYSMEEGQYEEYITRLVNLRELQQLQKQADEKALEWLNDQNAFYRDYFSNISNIELLYHDVLHKIVVPALLENLANNKDAIGFSKNMLDIAKDLKDKSSNEILIIMANELVRLGGE